MNNTSAFFVKKPRNSRILSNYALITFAQFCMQNLLYTYLNSLITSKLYICFRKTLCLLVIIKSLEQNYSTMHKRNVWRNPY